MLASNIFRGNSLWSRTSRITLYPHLFKRKKASSAKREQHESNATDQSAKFPSANRSQQTPTSAPEKKKDFQRTLKAKKISRSQRRLEELSFSSIEKLVDWKSFSTNLIAPYYIGSQKTGISATEDPLSLLSFSVTASDANTHNMIQKYLTADWNGNFTPATFSTLPAPSLNVSVALHQSTVNTDKYKPRRFQSNSLIRLYHSLSSAQRLSRFSHGPREKSKGGYHRILLRGGEAWQWSMETPQDRITDPRNVYSPHLALTSLARRFHIDPAARVKGPMLVFSEHTNKWISLRMKDQTPQDKFSTNDFASGHALLPGDVLYPAWEDLQRVLRSAYISVILKELISYPFIPYPTNPNNPPTPDHTTSSPLPSPHTTPDFEPSEPIHPLWLRADALYNPRTHKLLLLMGPPNSGKTTLALQLLSSHPETQLLSTWSVVVAAQSTLSPLSYHTHPSSLSHTQPTPSQPTPSQVMSETSEGFSQGCESPSTPSQLTPSHIVHKTSNGSSEHCDSHPTPSPVLPKTTNASSEHCNSHPTPSPVPPKTSNGSSGRSASPPFPSPPSPYPLPSLQLIGTPAPHSLKPGTLCGNLCPNPRLRDTLRRDPAVGRYLRENAPARPTDLWWEAPAEIPLCVTACFGEGRVGVSGGAVTAPTLSVLLLHWNVDKGSMGGSRGGTFVRDGGGGVPVGVRVEAVERALMQHAGVRYAVRRKRPEECGEGEVALGDSRVMRALCCGDEGGVQGTRDGESPVRWCEISGGEFSGGYKVRA